MKSLLLLCLAFLLTNVLLAQNRYDVVIDEIMIDPSPQLGLPANEWIELKNASNSPVNLQGWRISDATGQSGAMPEFILEPGSFVILCTGSAVAGMSGFGNTLPVTSFPSLDNDGELLLLKDANGMIVHALNYSSAWYQNELKREGGWTLEMIDTQNPCTGGSNWKASIHSVGGTPGAKNSVDALNNDQTGPQLKNAYTTDNTTIVLTFDEPVDSLNAAAISHYVIDGGASFSGAILLSPLFTQVELKTNAPLSANTIYNVTVSGVIDCKSNVIGLVNKARVGLAVDATTGECIVNEILFNPRSNANDYVEFYNKSSTILDASKLYIANRSSTGVVSSIKQLSTSPLYVFPGDCLVVTEDADNLALNYLVKNTDAVLTLSSLPSFPDDGGTVIMLNQQGDVIDEVSYLDDWHFKLIDNPEGVSLERIDVEGTSQSADNWHSAASTAGYGTPGYKNSQFKNQQNIVATVAVTPKVFSPDNDGFDDIAAIQYNTGEPGYVANITIFDAAGRPIRNLVRNGVLSTAGYWNWDGLDDKGQKLPVGTYIIFTEIFNLQGRKDRFKNTVVLARKLN
jgi:hypothetical protein